MLTKHLDKLYRRHRRVSLNLHGDGKKPRIAVHRSNSYIYAQAIDDAKRVTVAAFSSLQLRKEKGYKKLTKKAEAAAVGKRLGKMLVGQKITQALFDRSGHIYKGRVQALADGLRAENIKI